jgi:hypothetical protein
MRPAAHSGFQILPGGNRGRARTGTDWLVTAFVGLVIVAVLVAIVSGISSEKRAIRALPDEQRLSVLSRTVDELRQFCGEGRPEALKDHCRELASFAAQFDECRGECESLVRRQLAPAPTR